MKFVESKYSHILLAVTSFLVTAGFAVPFSASAIEHLKPVVETPLSRAARKMVVVAAEAANEAIIGQVGSNGATGVPPGNANVGAIPNTQTPSAAKDSSAPPAPVPEGTIAPPITGAPNSGEGATQLLPSEGGAGNKLLPQPIAESPNANQLPVTSITGPYISPSERVAGDKEGEVSRFFNKRPQSKSKAPAKKPNEEHTTKVIVPPAAPVVPGALKPGENPEPYQRPDTNYRTQRLPGAISQKTYSRENQHLPPAVYNEEYKKILFDSAATGNLDVLRAMVDDFGDTEIQDIEGNTPLIYAAMAGNLQSVITLVSMSANVNARNFSGVSSLYAATKLGRLDMVMYLFSRVNNIDDSDINNQSPVMVAAEMDFSRIATLLIKSGADIDQRMKNGNMAVHLAAKNDSVATLNLLLTNGANPDVRNGIGNTPLMLAAANGREKAVALLLNAGVDISTVNNRGQSTADIAAQSGNPIIIELIESEKIKRNLLAEKLMKIRKTRVEVEDVIPIGDDITAKRNKGIPLPVLNPGIKSIGTKSKRPPPPQPLFTPNELDKMRKGG